MKKTLPLFVAMLFAAVSTVHAQRLTPSKAPAGVKKEKSAQPEKVNPEALQAAKDKSSKPRAQEKSTQPGAGK